MNNYEKFVSVRVGLLWYPFEARLVDFYYNKVVFRKHSVGYLTKSKCDKICKHFNGAYRHGWMECYLERVMKG